MYIEISHEKFREFCRCRAAGHCMFMNQSCVEECCPVWVQYRDELRALDDDEIADSPQQAAGTPQPQDNG